jgi:DNA-binding winged helix-turn-helix (wHTH) protein
MSRGNRQLYEFGPFRIDLEERMLFRDRQPVPLPPKAFDTLLILVNQSGRVVLKDDLMKTLWPDSFVEEANLSQNIFVLRKALGETAQDARYITTVSGRGYRFAQEVRKVATAENVTAVESPLLPGVPLDGIPRSKIPLATVRARSYRSLGVVFAIGLVLVTGYWAWRASRPRARTPPGRMMLAVLPFQNLTGDPEQE